MREGASDTHTKCSLTREYIIWSLLMSDQVLIPVAVSPHCAWGPMFARFWFGDVPPVRYKFPATRDAARHMFMRAMNSPCPTNVVGLAKARWTKDKGSTSSTFFGNSYTCPTPREYMYQKFGLAMTTARAIHRRDAIQGILQEPVDQDN